MRNQIVVSALTAAIVSVLCFLFIPLKTPAEKAASEEKERVSAYERILESGEIRTAFAVGAPLFTVDPNTKRKGGIFYEIVEGIGKKLKLRINWIEEVGYGEMIRGLGTRYDLMGSGVWLNADRGKRADFSIPIYYESVFAFVRAGDNRFDSGLDILNDSKFTISTMDGELGATIAETDFPLTSRVALPQAADFSQLILNVVNKKADIVFLALAPAREYQRANPGLIRMATSTPLRVFPVTIMLPKGTYELKESIDNALIEMTTNGEIERILKKHESVADSFLRLAPPFKTESQ